ncbi:hypothetical protein [Kibdelosporangium aridum]|uniref:hypothetical protein n=1 Tax=Kibdelosporangium aridum TaxID=2030 RepID=UPI00068CDF13
MSQGQADLFSGERVLWTGAPTRYPVFTRADVFMVPFSVLWCGFAIFWTVNAASTAPPFALFGMIFVVIGLYMVFGRLITRWLRLRGTTYTVTDRRVVVRSALFGRQQERSAYLDALPPPVLAGTDTTGTITFGTTSLMDEFRASQGFMPGGLDSRPFIPALVAVSNARNVRDIIATAQAPKRS